MGKDRKIEWTKEDWTDYTPKELKAIQLSTKLERLEERIENARLWGVTANNKAEANKKALLELIKSDQDFTDLVKKHLAEVMEHQIETDARLNALETKKKKKRRFKDWFKKRKEEIILSINLFIWLVLMILWICVVAGVF